MARPKKRCEPDLVLALDFGGSLTKGIYLDKASGDPKLLCMEPEVICVPKSAIENYEATKLGAFDPADSAWVGLGGTDYYAVGYLASSQFNGNPGLSQLKYERAAFKTLATVWVAATRLGLKSAFTTAVTVLLPPGEYENAARLQGTIASHLKQFETPSGTLSVELAYWDCKCEGAGIYLSHSSKQGETLNRKTVAVVMLGYRNSSILLSERGIVTKRVTSNLGFIQLVEAVRRRISSVVSTLRLAGAIAQAGDEVERTILRPLVTSTLRENAAEDLDTLIQAVRDARQQYVFQLRSWFGEVLPRQLVVDEVLLCGGTAEYLQRELEAYFAGAKIIWNAGIELPLHWRDESVGTRLCDVYGMYRYFLIAVSKLVSEAKSSRQKGVKASA